MSRSVTLTLMRVTVVALVCGGLLVGCVKNPTPIANGFTPTPIPSATPSSHPVPLLAQKWVFRGWGVSLAWWAEIVGGWTPGQQVSASPQLSADEQPIVNALFGAPAAGAWPTVGGTPVPPLGLTVLRYNVGASPANGASDSCQASFRPGAAVPTVMAGAGAGQSVNLQADAGQVNLLKAASNLITQEGGTPVVEAFANSPPYWLVPGGCPQGTNGPENLSPGDESEYASYLAAVAGALKGDGTDVSTVDPLNEPTTPWPNGCSSSCQEGAGFSLDTQRAILSKLCAALPSGMSVAAPDGSSPEVTLGAWQNFLSSLPCLAQVNTHSYAGGPSPYVGPYRPALAPPGFPRPVWMSEFGSSSAVASTDSQGTVPGVATQIADDLNQMRPDAWVYWTAMEGPGGWGLFDDPRLGNASPGSGSTADPGIGQVSATERYFTLAQFTRFIRPGDTIIPVSANFPSGVRVVMADTKANGPVVVAVNPNPESEPLSFDLGTLGVGNNIAVSGYRTDGSDSLAQLPQSQAGSVSGGLLTDTLPAMSVTTYLVGLPAADTVYVAPGGFRTPAPQADLRDDYRPVGLVLEGNGGAGFFDLTWPVWDSTEAVAQGKYGIDDCQPDCATGHYTKYPVIVTFTDPENCGGNLYWSKALTRFTAAIPPGWSQEFVSSPLVQNC